MRFPEATVGSSGHKAGTIDVRSSWPDVPGPGARAHACRPGLPAASAAAGARHRQPASPGARPHTTCTSDTREADRRPRARPDHRSRWLRRRRRYGGMCRFVASFWSAVRVQDDSRLPVPIAHRHGGATRGSFGAGPRNGFRMDRGAAQTPGPVLLSERKGARGSNHLGSDTDGRNNE